MLCACTVVDIDTCSSSPCQNGGTCQPVVTVALDSSGHSFYYHCMCVEGFYGKHCEQSQCIVVSLSFYTPSPPSSPLLSPPPSPCPPLPLPPPLEQGRLGIFDVFLLCCHLSSLVCDISCGSFGVLVHHHLLSVIFLVLTKCDVLVCVRFHVVFLVLTKCGVQVHLHLLCVIFHMVFFGLTKCGVLLHHHL